MKIFVGTHDALSAYDQHEWPSGVVPVMFVVAPSGKVSHVDILENTPNDSTVAHSIEEVYYGLEFSPFTKQIPDTIVFNSVYSPKK